MVGVDGQLDRQGKELEQRHRENTQKESTLVVAVAVTVAAGIAAGQLVEFVLPGDMGAVVLQDGPPGSRKPKSQALGGGRKWIVDDDASVDKDLLLAVAAERVVRRRAYDCEGQEIG